MTDRRAFWLFGLLLFLLGGCTGDPAEGPVEVKWDRDQCERCRMVVSDRMHAAEVRQPLDNGRSKVLRFDDFGCAVIWLEEQPWKADPRVEFWVTDYRTGEWIDARKAFFVSGRVTPMEYGLGAQKDSAEGALDYAAAKAHVFEVERRLGIHHVHAPGIPDIQEPPAGARE